MINFIIYSIILLLFHNKIYVLILIIPFLHIVIPVLNNIRINQNEE